MYKSETTNNSTGERFYVDKDNVKYVSTTTLIGYYEDKSGLQAWYNRLGEEEANKVRDASADRGKQVHSYVEDYLKDKLATFDISNFEDVGTEHQIIDMFNQPMSSKIIELGERAVNNFYRHTVPVRMEEVVFFSDSVARFAGRYDQLLYIPENKFCLANSFDTIPEGNYLVDLKTKNKMPRFDKADYLIKYLLQGSAYVQALKEIEGISVKGFILVFVTSRKCRMMYIDAARLSFYWNHFYNMMLDYYKIKPLDYTWSDIIREANSTYDFTTLDMMDYIPEEIYVV
jgi:hypothetical protein